MDDVCLLVNIKLTERIFVCINYFPLKDTFPWYFIISSFYLSIDNKMSNSVTKLFLVVQWLGSTDCSFCDHIPLKLVWLRSNGRIPGFKTRAIKAQNCQLIIEGFPLSVPLLRSTNTEEPSKIIIREGRQE